MIGPKIAWGVCEWGEWRGGRATVEPSARTTVVLHADCRADMPSRFLCTGTGLDAVHRTGAGDQHAVAGILGCEISGSRRLFRVG